MHNTEKIDIEKAESSPSPSTTRLKLGEIGSPNVKTIGGLIREEARKDLQFPRCLTTFDEMRQDATVDAGLTVNEVFLTKAMMGMKWKVGESGSELSKSYADALNWNFKNFDQQTWYQIITSVITYQQYGFSWLEKVYTKNKSKSHPILKNKIKKLATRTQKSVAKWEFSKDKRELLGVWQKPETSIDTLFPSAVNINNQLDTYIPRYKYMLFSWDDKGGNPQGKSLLTGCFRAYKEKSMIASYEVVGVSKDMG